MNYVKFSQRRYTHIYIYVFTHVKKMESGKKESIEKKQSKMGKMRKIVFEGKYFARIETNRGTG